MTHLLSPFIAAILLLLVRPAPVRCLYPFKLLNDSAHLRLLSPAQWTDEFTCQLHQNATTSPPPYECQREPTAWRFNYLRELERDFQVLIHEDSLDERLANIFYTVSSNVGIDLHAYKFNSADPQQDLRNERLVAGPQVDDARCLQQLERMLAVYEDLRNRLQEARNLSRAQLELDEEHFRLARLLDSFGRFESGALSGRYHAFGIYQQCLATPLRLEGQLVNSRYCWAKLSLERRLSEPLRRRRRFEGEGDNFGLHVAVCVPESCHSRSFNPKQPGNGASARRARQILQQLLDSQLVLPDSLYLERQLPIESLFCLVDDSSAWARMPLAGRLFICAALGWLALLVVATLRRRQKHVLPLEPHLGPDDRSRARSLLSQLDLFESWLEFIGERHVPRQGRVELDVLNPLKVVASSAVIIGHSGIITGPLSRQGLISVAASDRSHIDMMVLSSFVIVDTFFVISGILMTYITLTKLAARHRRRQQFELSQRADSELKPEIRREGANFNGRRFLAGWLYVTLHRYCRLVPLFFLAFWFKKSLFNQLGSGPLWDWALNRDTPAGGCRDESWTTPFTFLGAYLPLGRQCLPATWSLSNDLLFSLVVPPLILLLFQRPRLARGLAFIALLASVAASLAAYYAIEPLYRFELEQVRIHGVMLLFSMASQLYTNPLYRIPAMLVGVLAGHALFHYDQAAQPHRLVLDERRDWPWWLRRIVTPVALAYLFVCLLATYFTVELRDWLGPKRVGYLVPLVLVGYHITWSLANAAIFLRMLTDWKDSFLMRMSSGRFFRVYSKLTFALLLVHWDLLIYEASTRTYPVVFSTATYFARFTMAYFWALPLSIFIHVAVESPLDKLAKTYIFGR